MGPSVDWPYLYVNQTVPFKLSYFILYLGVKSLSHSNLKATVELNSILCPSRSRPLNFKVGLT
jgi:hypothetical protein